ncbi:MAG: 1-deoxy-D-xylulose-5-phosphate synthase [Syntrophorhabdaceae bacterium]|nr:1-deoxy-D-xylulose-5-phosphate synthase [Syntrophorhabdaceae bacterium]HQG51418.1 1-deoxy-D-xylulose-5-phosphate synthase [Syntrophorhabdaceae bacterium]
MYLEKINSPDDLKRLVLPELETLSDEIRTLIIEVVSKNGGHLSSSLGVVELTLALHYVFDTPVDKIIWDVGHQCYTHKIITGRREKFRTLRQDNGISGFPSRQESVYDVFNTGHASNSISIAVGLSEAKKKMNQSHKIVTVIGDGSLTGGMSFEALNHAGHLKSDIIVILNDNEMSISKNIGALSSHLSRIMTGEFVSNAREELKKMLKNIPALGDKVYKAAKHIEESIKGFVTPGIIFEQLGFQYFGPVDGHNLNYLIETFKNIKRLKGPIFVHIVTKKGRGYIHAEDDPAKFHGISKFEVETGAPSGDKTEAYTDIFGDAIIELAEKYDKIIAITAAMGLGTGLEKFSKRFPDRFFDIGIAEQHGVTFAAALALGGLKPFVAIYSTFLQRSYDQIILDVCLQGLPVVFAVDRSGIVGQDGPTHHGAFDITYFRHIPNMILMAPKDGEELRHMLYSAYMYDKPTAIRYPRGKVHGPKTFNGFEEIPIGTWEKLRDGDDLAIIACGNTVYPSIQAATELAAEGIQCTVINGRFIKPMDKDMLFEMACSKKRILTVEENTLVGGFGGGIMEFLSDEGIYASVRRLGMPDKFLTYGTQETLRGKVGLTSEGIKNTIRKWLKNV